MKTVQESIAKSFFSDFTREVLHQAREANATTYSKELDGFHIANFKDGWVEFRGMSFGFAYLSDQNQISLTFGPDAPFVGYQQIFDLRVDGDNVKCVSLDDDAIYFNNPNEFAKYGLNRLVSKANPA